LRIWFLRAAAVQREQLSSSGRIPSWKSVADPDQVMHAMEQSVTALGRRLDIMVASAGQKNVR